MNWDKYLCKNRFRDSITGNNNDHRNEFESDYGRVLFSSAIRRMHDKTQVIPLTNGDSVLTRLTHSIQVMNIAESLILNYTRGEKFISEHPDYTERYDLTSALTAIVRSAAFVHDVGNPPFGHFGETVIKNYFKDQNNLPKCFFSDKTENLGEIKMKNLDFTEFDGNAQGFRILTKLQYIGALDGLNLTYATLAAFMKYPNDNISCKDYIGTKKHGVFWTEKDIFNKVVDSCNLKCGKNKIKRHPLSFIVEAADSIAYRVMDIEDGLNLKWFSFELLIKEINSILTTRFNINRDIRDIINLTTNDTIESAEKKTMIDFRVALIQYFVNLAVKNFEENIEEIDSGLYNKELIEDDDNKISKSLEEFSNRYIFSRREICSEEITGKTVLTGLLDYLSFYAFHEEDTYRTKFKSLISRSRLEIAIHENKYPKEGYKFFSNRDLFDFDILDIGNYGRWRMIVDFISSMTDKYAVELYQQLSGNRI